MLMEQDDNGFIFNRDKIYIITYVYDNGDEYDVRPVLRFGFFTEEEDARAKAKQLNENFPKELKRKKEEHYSHTVVFQAKTED